MKITKISEDTYPTLTNTSTVGNWYEAFIESLSTYRNSAIEAAYHNGYITDEEAVKLKEGGLVRRNEYTYIQVADSFDKITLYCNELTDDAVCTRIFKLSYMKDNGILIDELNTDIVN